MLKLSNLAKITKWLQNSFIKTLVFDVYYQNLIPNFWNLVSGFFPEFPDPVFFRKKSLRGFAPWKTLGHFVHFVPKQSYISPSVTWRKLEYMKNAKNILFWHLEPFFWKILLQKPPLKSDFRKIWGPKFSGFRIRFFTRTLYFSGFSGFFESLESISYLDSL